MNPSNPDHRRSAGSMPDAGNGTTRRKIEECVGDAEREVSAQAREKAATGKHRLAGGADALSNAIDAAASYLEDYDRELGETRDCSVDAARSRAASKFDEVRESAIEVGRWHG